MKNKKNKPGFANRIAQNKAQTLQREDEKKILKSEESRLLLFDNMLNGFAYCKMLFDDNNRPVDFIYLAVNKAFERLTGLKDVIGKRVSEVIPEIKETSPELFETYGRVALSGQSDKFEFYFKSLDIWLSVSVYRPEKGYFVTMFENITDSKRVEKALMESEEQFNALFDNSLTAMAVIEPDTTISMVNDTYCKMSGYTKDEVVGMSWTKQIPPDDLERLKEYNRRRIINTKDAPDQYEFKFYHRNGDVMYGHMHVLSIQSKHKIIASFVNISEQKTVKKDLIQSEEKFRKVFDNAGDAMLIGRIIPGFKLLDSNYKLSEMLGYSKTELIEIDPHSLLADDMVAGMEERVEKIKTEKSVIYENRYKCKDGRIIPVELNSTIIDYMGEPALLTVVRDMTEHKKAEEKLIKIQQSLVDAQAISHVVSWEYDVQKDELVWSDEVYRIFGIDKNDFEGRNSAFEKSIHPEDLNMVNEYREKIIEGKEKGEFMHRIIHPDGTVRYVVERSRLVFDENGVHIKDVGTIQDVTELKQAENKLRENARMHQTLLDCMPCVALLLRPGNREIVAMNKAAEETGAVIGNTCFIGWPKFREPCKFCLAPEVWDTGEQRQIIVESGGIVWDVHWVPVSDDLYMHYAFDVTEVKKAEKALKVSETRYRRLFESAKDGILILNAETAQIVDVNPFLVKLLGYTYEEFLGKKLWEIGPFENMFLSKISFSELQEKGYVRYENLPIETANGQSISVEFVSNVYLVDNVKVIQCNIRDTTEHNRSEEEKKKLQSQLTQAQKMESVGRLAGGVAHDFNNMLGVIIGNAELAMGELNPLDPLYGSLQEILKASNRSAKLTRQLLAFARKQPVAPKVIDLNETVENMLKLLRRLIGEDIDLAWMPGSGLWTIKMDISQIDQIMANLCVNARDAISDVGKVTIETENITFDVDYCSGHEGYIPGEYVLLAVSDTGCGMDKETLTKLFEPFFTTKEIGKGTGLGLATVYGIVKQNNGFINVYSEVGYGTTFKIYLPRHVGETVKSKEELPTKVFTGNGETVLVVEDEPEMLELTKRILVSLHYNVLAAPTIGEAIFLAEKNKNNLNLLITDLIMPDMNGKDLAEKIKSICPGLKCLFMSGYTANIIASQGIIDKDIHFIQKPFLVKDIAAKIRAVLESG